MTEPAARAKRRSGSQKRQRTRHIAVHCTEEQFAAISEKAQASGISRSAYALKTMLDARPPRQRRRLPVVNGELLAEGITAINRANNSANQIARELNQQKFMPDGGMLVRALHGVLRCPACAAEVKSPEARFCTKCGFALSGKLAAQDNGAILAIEAMRGIVEAAFGDLKAADAIIYAAGYSDDVRRR